MSVDISGNVRAEVARARRDGRSVAASAGLSRSTWDRRMVDAGTWRMAELVLVADALGITVDRLLTGTPGPSS